MAIEFSKDQQKAIDIRNKNVMVSASAGSGKTAVLVERLCQLVLKDRISIDRIVSMTFTKEAANEMKARLRARLQQELSNPQADMDYINNQLALLETAQITTIHSFCLHLVKTYYYKAGISYTMAQTISDDVQSQKTLDAGYQKALETIDMKDLLSYFRAFHLSDGDIQDLVTHCIDIAWSKPEPEQWLQDVLHIDSQAWFYRYFQDRIEVLIENFTWHQSWEC